MSRSDAPDTPEAAEAAAAVRSALRDVDVTKIAHDRQRQAAAAAIRHALSLDAPHRWTIATLATAVGATREQVAGFARRRKA